MTSLFGISKLTLNPRSKIGLRFLKQLRKMKTIFPAWLVLFLHLAPFHLVRADEERDVTLNFPECPAEMAVAFYSTFTGKTVEFEEEKEKKRLVAIISEGRLTRREAIDLIASCLRIEGLEIVDGKDGRKQVRVLEEEIVRELNRKAGREWQGPRYSTRGRVVVPPKD